MKKIILCLVALTSISAFSAVYDPKAIWPKENIKNGISVCIYDPNVNGFIREPGITAVPQTYLNLVKDSIQNEYQRETTGIEFKDFEACEEKNKANVVLYFVNDMLGSGRADFYSKSKYYLKVKIKKPKFDDDNDVNMSIGTIVHEFGHTAGLIHEHEYFESEALLDSNCNIKNKHGLSYADFILDNIKRFKKMGIYDSVYRKQYKHYIALEDYDPLSIMNYCSNNVSVENLSATDKKTLQSIYK